MVRRFVAPKQFISGFRARFLARSAWNDIFYEVALLELETRARRTGRETSDCNSRERLGRALD